jgi:hypothetical protein
LKDLDKLAKHTASHFSKALWSNIFDVCHTPIACMILPPCSIHQKDKKFMKRREDFHKKKDK